MYIKPLKGKDAEKFWDAFYKSGIRKEALEKAKKLLIKASILSNWGFYLCCMNTNKSFTGGMILRMFKWRVTCGPSLILLTLTYKIFIILLLTIIFIK